MEERVRKVVSQVFGLAADSITDDSSVDTIEKWDSLSHINLILALEGEFGVSLTPEDVMEMLSVKLIRMILAERGVA